MKTTFLSVFAISSVWAGIAFAAAGGDHADKAEGGSGLPQLDPTSYPTQIFWLLILFGVLYFFFSKKTLPEISGVIETRQEHIQNDLDTAEKLRKEAEETQGAYEAKLNDARKKASKYYADAEQKIKDKINKETEAFSKRSAEAIADAEKRIEKSKTTLLKEMDMMAAELSSDVAEKIIGATTDKKKAEDIVKSINKHPKAA